MATMGMVTGMDTAIIITIIARDLLKRSARSVKKPTKNTRSLTNITKKLTRKNTSPRALAAGKKPELNGRKQIPNQPLLSENRHAGVKMNKFHCTKK